MELPWVIDQHNTAEPVLNLLANCFYITEKFIGDDVNGE